MAMNMGSPCLAMASMMIGAMVAAGRETVRAGEI
jgi:hypothetical protein